jgi:hypothetical protein
MVDDHSDVTLLDLATELATEFVGAKFDDRVMRYPLDGAIESIEGDRNLGGFDEQPRKFFLKFDGVPFHGQAPVESIPLPQTASSSSSYHESAVFLH